MNIRQHFLTLTLAVVFVGGLRSFAWLSAEPPEATTPSAESNQAPKDPLYQAIRDQLNADRPSLIPGDNQPVIQRQIARDNSVSAAEWEAVELILRAARILEREEKLQGINNRAADQQSTAKQLRAHALQILRRAIEP